MRKVKKKVPVHKCPGCGRRVAKNTDNWDPVAEHYIHTKCWFRIQPPRRRGK